MKISSSSRITTTPGPLAAIFVTTLVLAGTVAPSSAAVQSLTVNGGFDCDSTNPEAKKLVIPVSLPPGSRITGFSYDTIVQLKDLKGVHTANGTEGFTLDYMVSRTDTFVPGQSASYYLLPDFMDQIGTYAYAEPLAPLASHTQGDPGNPPPASILLPDGQASIVFFGYCYADQNNTQPVKASAGLTGTFTIQYEPPVDLRITAFTRTPAQVSLTWTSVSGASYQVQESPDLLTWTTRQTLSATAASTSASITPTAFPAGRGFYRIQTAP